MLLEVKPEEVVTNVRGSRPVPMTIDQASVKYIVRNLTHIYPDKLLAVLREYSTNAYDSHLEAGNTDPIRVTLPSAFSPSLIIEDCGIGMNRQGLLNYGIYGFSTKRENAEAIGAFGLGSKSALTLVSSFSIVSIKDGKKFTALVNKDVEGVGQIEVLSDVDTDEPNGVKITIPTNEGTRLAELAKDLFLTWKPGTVLVNGSQPKHIESTDDYRKIGDLGYFGAANKHSNRGNISIIMGGISYKVGHLTHEQRTAIYGDKQWVTRYEIALLAELADVDLLPSREDVDMSEKTLAFIKDKLNAIVDSFMTDMLESVAKAETRMQAVRVIEDFPFGIVRSEYRWHGTEIPEYVNFPMEVWDVNKFVSKVVRQEASNLKISTDSKFMIIDTSTFFENTSVLTRQIRAWIKAESITNSRLRVGSMLSVTGENSNPWFTAMVEEGFITVVKAEDVVEKGKAYTKANRKPRVGNGGSGSSGPRETLTYPTYYAGSTETHPTGHQMTSTEIKAAFTKIYYVDQSNSGVGLRSGFNFSYYYHGKEEAKNVVENYLPKGSVLVMVANNRKIESFIKRMGATKAIDFMPVIEKAIHKRLSIKTSSIAEIAQTIKQTSSYGMFFKKMDVTKIDSPFFRDVIKSVIGSDKAKSASEKFDTASDDAATFLGWGRYKCNEIRLEANPTVDANLFGGFMKHYPLILVIISGSRYNASYDIEIMDGAANYVNYVHATKGDFVEPEVSEVSAQAA